MSLLGFMNDTEELPPSDENIRTILYNLGQAIDERLAYFRRGTPYESVRPSDVRVFVSATRKLQTISEIARALGITRQAVQISVKRLQGLQIIALESHPQNKRDKMVVVTHRGKHALKTANLQIKRFEAEFSATLGDVELTSLRKNLLTILESTRLLNKSDAE
jgi:DNA-binding MarR family transcriptional regulator